MNYCNIQLLLLLEDNGLTVDDIILYVPSLQNTDRENILNS